jgi:XTP/dITP diphosphohydrolase
MPLLVLGTHNRKKFGELAHLLAPFGFDLRSLDEFADALEVEETGATFEENARLKATQQARHLQTWVLAEDSGLVVDALGGEPGVMSARFSGPGATDESNNCLLLARLADVPLEKRTAHYVCHATLSDPAGGVRAEGIGACHGRIRFEEAGTGGFGYDPMFEILEYHRTFGELGPAVKAALSHRARAIRSMLPRLVDLAGSGEWS